MRVAVLHGSNDTYGASRVLLCDVGGWVDSGHEVEVFLPYDGPLTKSLEEMGAVVRIEPLHVLRRSEPGSLRQAPFAALAQIPSWSGRPDVVVLWTLALAAYLPALKLRRYTVVVSVHELILGAAGAPLAAVTAALADVVQANSQAIGNWVAGFGVRRSRLFVAYPAAPAFDPFPLPPGDGRVRLLFPGRVSERKGQVAFVDLVDQVRAETSADVRLTILGAPFHADGVSQTKLDNALAARTWASHEGEVPDIRPWLASHDLVVSFSILPEPFGLTPLEAWAAGRRSVGRPAGGMAESLMLADGIPLPEGKERDVLAAVVTDERWRRPPDGHEPASVIATTDARHRTWRQILRMEGRRSA